VEADGALTVEYDDVVETEPVFVDGTCVDGAAEDFKFVDDFTPLVFTITSFELLGTSTSMIIDG